MGTSDLIRLATELAECGGVHRLTSLINAAVHVHLEHERHARAFIDALEREQRRTVEAWEDGPECGVGMSDKVARDLTLEIHDDAQRALRDRPPRYRPQAPSRAPEREEASGGISRQAETETRLTSPGTGLASKSVKPFCETLANPAPLTSINGERKPLPQSDCQGEYPRGGISHEPGSPLLKAQDDFGRRERLVPKFDGKRTNPEDLGDGA